MLGWSVFYVLKQNAWSSYEGNKKYFYLGEWEYHVVEKKMQPGMTDGEDCKAAIGIKIEFKNVLVVIGLSLYEWMASINWVQQHLPGAAALICLDGAIGNGQSLVLGEMHVHV